MTTIRISRKYYSIPTEWKELSATQLLQVMDVLFLKGYKAEEMVMKLLQVLTGMSEYRFLKADVEELNEYFYLLAFLLRPDIVFTKNLLPQIEDVEMNFYGPADGLTNLRMKEFALTEDAYTRWWESEKQDGDALDELISIIYRPAPRNYDFQKNEAGDFREPFNENISAFYAKKYISKWPVNKKLAIAAWYNGCRQHIVNINPEVFSGAGEPSQFGLVSVMLEVAESHVFGDFDKVEQKDVYLVMMELNRVVEKAKKLEAQTTT